MCINNRNLIRFYCMLDYNKMLGNRIEILFKPQVKVQLQQLKNLQDKALQKAVLFIKEYFQAGKIKGQKDHYVQNKIQEPLKAFKYPQKQKFFCDNIYKNSPYPIYAFYKCEECQIQKNSLICTECFDPKKHENHNYRLINLQGGSCDCGDETNLKEECFCERHRVCNKETEQQLSMNEQQELKYTIRYYVRTFLSLFLQLFFKNKAIEKQSKIKLDLLGQIFFDEIRQLNLNRLLINRLTLEVFQESILYYDPYFEKKNIYIKIKYVLLRLIELEKTSFQVYRLYLILFYQNQALRQDITIEFIHNYVEIVQYNLSQYHHFAPQLLNNSFLIQQLCKQNKMPLFLINYQKKYPKKSINEKIYKHQIQRLGKQLINFTNDIKYFLMLIPACAKIYWNYFADKKGFIMLGQYSQIYNQQPFLKEINKHSYFEQQIIVRFIDILNLMMVIDDQKRFMPKVLSQLYAKISETKQTYNSNNNRYDYSMIYQRMWAIASYVILITKIPKCNVFSLINNQRAHQEAFQLLYHYNQIKDYTMAAYVIQMVFQRVLSYFKKIIYLELDQRLKSQNSALFNLYFCSINTLFSIDQIIFKLCLKFMRFLQDLNKKKDAVNIKNILVPTLQKFLHYKDQLTQANMNYNIKSYIFLVGIIRQALYSDLSDLVLSSNFSSISETQEYKMAYQSYFNNLYNTIIFKNNLQVDIIKQIHYYCRMVLFYKESVIQNLNFKKLQSNKQYEVNLDYYYQIKYKIGHLQMNKNIKNAPLQALNFYFTNPHRYLEIQSILIDSFLNFMRKIMPFHEEKNKRSAFYDQKEIVNEIRQLVQISMYQMQKLSILTNNEKLKYQCSYYLKQKNEKQFQDYQSINQKQNQKYLQEQKLSSDQQESSDINYSGLHE